ncbi:hemopexin isoform 1-T1 [Anomaloglossus baeobatrachus]|uniref:hemopexin isoform X1 n=1 Tax=Anomaloglossus baeobatrachus TaxID=238106 RepID=UPI003F5027D6
MAALAELLEMVRGASEVVGVDALRQQLAAVCGAGAAPPAVPAPGPWLRARRARPPDRYSPSWRGRIRSRSPCGDPPEQRRSPPTNLGEQPATGRNPRRRSRGSGVGGASARPTSGPRPAQHQTGAWMTAAPSDVPAGGGARRAGLPEETPCRPQGRATGRGTGADVSGEVRRSEEGYGGPQAQRRSVVTVPPGEERAGGGSRREASSARPSGSRQGGSPLRTTGEGAAQQDITITAGRDGGRAPRREKRKRSSRSRPDERGAVTVGVDGRQVRAVPSLVPPEDFGSASDSSEEEGAAAGRTERQLEDRGTAVPASTQRQPGGWYFRLDSSKDGWHPWPLNHTWSNLQGVVDAAFTFANRMYFIQGSQVSVYLSDQIYIPVAGYPKAIQEEWDVSGVTAVDAAFTCPHSSDLYLIMGNKLILVDLTTQKRYGEDRTIIHTNLDSAMCNTHGLYLLQGPIFYHYKNVEELLSSRKAPAPGDISSYFLDC